MWGCDIKAPVKLNKFSSNFLAQRDLVSQKFILLAF